MNDITTSDENNKKEDTHVSTEKLSADQEIDATIKKSRFEKKKRQAKSRKIKYGAAALVVAFIGLFLQWALTPYQGSMAFGICKVFLELSTRYPTTIKHSAVEELGGSVRIWYAQTDSFGEYQVEPIQCYFRADETYGSALDRVTIRRREIDSEIIENFNRSLPVIFAHQPSLDLPIPLPDSLRDLQINTHLFRKPIL